MTEHDIKRALADFAELVRLIEEHERMYGYPPHPSQVAERRRLDDELSNTRAAILDAFRECWTTDEVREMLMDAVDRTHTPYMYGLDDKTPTVEIADTIIAEWQKKREDKDD